MTDASMQRILRAIFSADVKGYSHLMRDDETATIRTLGSYREQISVLVGEHRGRVVDARGRRVRLMDPVTQHVTHQHGTIPADTVRQMADRLLPGARRQRLLVVLAVLLSCTLVAGATIVQSVFHTFSPQGVTGVVVVEESHLSIHTWPEYRFAMVDVWEQCTAYYASKNKVKKSRVYELLEQAFHIVGARGVRRELDRGLDALTPLVVGNAEHGRVDHTRVRHQASLDLGRIDVEAGHDDEVLGPVDQVQVPVVVDGGHSAR